MDFVLCLLNIIVVIIPFLFVIYRVLLNSGIKFKHAISFEKHESYEPTIKECLKIFLYIFIFRIFIILIGSLIYLIIISNGNFNLQDIINSYEKWDAISYIRISKGYSSYIENGDYTTLAFFPLYPFIISLFNIITDNAAFSGLLVSIISYSIASIFVYKLVCIDYGKKIAIKTLVLMSVFPFSFFFGSIMSESTFLLFSALTLFFIRKHNWILTGIFGLLASLSRSIGILLIIPAFIEILEEYKVFENIKNVKFMLNILFKKIIPLLLIPVGILIYLYINYNVTGNYFYFLDMQSKYFDQHFAPFYKIFSNLINSLNSEYFDMSFNLTTLIPELCILIFTYIILAISVKNNRSMYSMYLISYTLFITSISWPLSICRYFSCAIPLFIFLAVICQKKESLYTPIIIVFSMLFLIFFFSFLIGKAIM